MQLIEFQKQVLQVSSSYLFTSQVESRTVSVEKCFAPSNGAGFASYQVSIIVLTYRCYTWRYM